MRPAHPGPPARQFVAGEAFRYLGRQYRLEVREGPEERVKLEAGRLRVEARRPTAEAVREALVGWYRERALARLEERVEWWARRARVEAPRVRVREQERRWGSCSRGVVRFNWRIIQAPLGLVDYVVAHEVVHLEHDAHDRAFWAALGRLLPDYEARRERLHTEGPRLVW